MIKFKKILIFSVFIISTLSVYADSVWDINDGIKLFRNQKFDEAKAFFTSYTNNNPDDEDGFYWLAKTYKELNNKDTSKQFFKKTYDITIQKNDIEKNLFDEEISNPVFEDYYDMAIMYFENQNYKEARRYTDLMLKLNPKSASAYFVEAKILYITGDYENAKTAIENSVLYNNNVLKTNLAKALKVYEIPKANKEFYYTCGWEQYFKGNLEQAISYFRKYIELDSENVDIYNFLVELYIKNNELPNAISLCNEIETKFPNNIQNLVNKAKIYKLENKNDEISSILNKAYKINPNNKNLLYELGNYNYNNKNYKDAKLYYENLINVDDDFFEGYIGLIETLIQLRQIDDALLYVKKASKIKNDASQLNYLLAKICILNGEYNDALDYINSAIKKDKNNDYYLLNAQILYLMDKNISSLDGLENIDSDYFEKDKKVKVNDLYIANYLKLEDTESAQDCLKNENLLDKNSIIYKYYLYIIYKLEGNNVKTKEYYAQLKKAKPVKEKDYIVLSNFIAEENVKNAIKLLEKAQKIYPSSNEIYIQKGFLSKNN